MALFCYDNQRNCLAAAVIASVIVGVVTAFLSFAAVITVTPVFLWVVLGIAVGFLGLALASASLIQGTVPCRSFCPTLSALLIGILGTVLLAVILLAISFAATSLLSAIITGALLFFFSLILTAAACLVRCIVNCNN